MAGCGPSPLSEKGDIDFQLISGREYVKTLKDAYGNPILELGVKYIGKKPIGEFKYSHDWKNKDTDFYNVTWKNLSDQNIELLYCEHKWDVPIEDSRQEKKDKEGKYVKVTQPLKENLKKEWRDNVLEAKEEWRWDNDYVYNIKNKYNIAHTFYTLRHAGKEYKIDYSQVYRR